MSEKFDTSGAVYLPKDIDGRVWYDQKMWSDLSPFVQGYVEAMLQEFNRKCFGDFPITRKSHLVVFSDLAPETLVRIIEDCATLARRAGYLVAPDAEQGAITWRQRQGGEISEFPPITLYLNDAGKVVIR